MSVGGSNLELMELKLSSEFASRIEYLPVTGSTNSDLLSFAVNNPELWTDFSVLLTENQNSGRGRLDREFIAAPSSALLFSLYKKVTRPRVEWNFIALLAALSITDALAEFDSHVQLNVKWPNDILINEKKIAGILCQVVDNGVIVGVGLNVSMHQEELPVASATSLLLENYSELDRSEILKRILQNFEKNFQIFHGCYTKEPFGYAIFDAIDNGKVPIIHTDWMKHINYKYRANNKDEFNYKYLQILEDETDIVNSEFSNLKNELNKYTNKQKWVIEICKVLSI